MLVALNFVVYEFDIFLDRLRTVNNFISVFIVYRSLLEALIKYLKDKGNVDVVEHIL